jgi:hypothetical protein
LDDAETIAKVEQLAEAGIKTLVIGIPGSDNYVSVLDELADKGGARASDTSPKYYKVDDPEALTDTLVDLTTDLVTSCELALEENPPSLDRVNVFIDDEVLPQEGDDGWEYDMSTTPPTIVIKGQTCADIEMNGVDSVGVKFGCPTVIVK